MKLAICSGYFNPLTVAHIRYLKAAKEFGDFLYVIVNNDEQVKLKGSFPFMEEFHRLEIVQSIRGVDDAWLSASKDRSIEMDLITIKERYREPWKITFCNGGDVKNKKDCREAAICKKLGIAMKFGVGGKQKIASSSWLIENVIKNARGPI